MKKVVQPEYNLAELPVTDLGHVMQNIKNWRKTLSLLQAHKRRECLRMNIFNLKKKKKL